MPRPLPRPPFSEAHRARQAAAKRGRPRSPETKAKIAAALRGRKRPPEVVAKVTALRRARPRTDEEIIKECYERNTAKKDLDGKIRYRQAKKDRIVAMVAKRPDLANDVLDSQGYFKHRRIFDDTGAVSHGWCEDRGIVWVLTEEDRKGKVAEEE